MVYNPDKVDFPQHATKLRLKAAVRHNVTPEACHVGHLLLEAMHDNPGFINQIDAATGESETHAQVARAATQLAAALLRYGARPGDAVVVMGQNHLRLAVPFYACHFNGHGVCPMDPTIEPKDVSLLIHYVQPKIVFCPSAKEEVMKQAISDNDLACRVVTFDGSYDIDAFVKEYGGTENGYSPQVFDQQKTNAWLLLTSGTTGLPKVAMISFYALWNSIWTFWADMPFRLESVLAMATIQWLSTTMIFVSTPLAVSTRVQTSLEVTPAHLRDMINKYQPSATIFTPHILRQFLQEEGDACNLYSLILVLIGGSVVQKSILDHLQDKIRGFVLNSYSMTELLVPIFRYMPGEAPEGAIGLPMREKFQYRLVDDDGNTIDKPHQVGELWVKGDSFFQGYLNNPEETAKMITPDGWLKTGDMFCRDEKDFFYFKDRRRVLIKYKSRFVAPMEMEDVICRHPGVAAACVVGIPHPDCVQLSVAAISRRAGYSVEPDDIFNMVNEALPELKRLHGGLFFLDALPITPTGKIHRSKIAELALTAERILPRATA